MAQDYYQTLGVDRGASQADIQKAYRTLARKYHPDLNPDDKTAKQKFQEVQNAFDVLNDPAKRELYDRYGASFEQMGGGGPRPSGGGGAWPGEGSFQYGGSPEDFASAFGSRFGGDTAGGFADLFSQFKRAAQGGKEGRGNRARGHDVSYELHVPLATAVSGGSAQVQVRRASGKTETLEIKIPTGIDDGQTIRLRGQGEPSLGKGAPGDLLITIRVDPHSSFQRKEDNLHVRVPVTLAEAALGAKIEIPTPRGRVSLSVPPGTSSGTKLRVRGQGVAAPTRPAGDLYAEIQVVLPKQLDAESQQAIRRIDERYPLDPRRDLHW